VKRIKGTDASWNSGRGTSFSPALGQLTLKLHYCHIRVHSGQTLARHPLWLPAACSVSQWQHLNSSHLRHFSRFKCGNFCLKLMLPNTALTCNSWRILDYSRKILIHFHKSYTRERNLYFHKIRLLDNVFIRQWFSMKSAVLELDREWQRNKINRGEWLKKKGGCRPTSSRGNNEKMRERGINGRAPDRCCLRVIIGHCVSLARDRRKCDR